MSSDIKITISYTSFIFLFVLIFQCANEIPGSQVFLTLSNDLEPAKIQFEFEFFFVYLMGLILIEDFFSRN